MNHETQTEDGSIIITNWKWMLDSSFCSIFVALNGLILISEIKTRRQSTTLSSLSKYTKMWPIVCMTSGLGVELCGLVVFLPGFCHFTRQLEFFLSGLQGVSMGFFQLSRLYYLFMASGKGYSNIIFIFMYGIGILILMAIAIVSFLFPHINYCSLDNKLNYIENSGYFHWFHGGYTVIYVFAIVVSVYIEWDLITLILYVWKLAPFYFGKPCTDKKMNSIRSILYKIIILTFMYEMTVILVLNDVFMEMATSSNIIHIDSILVFIFLEGLLSTSMSYAILLMQQHNQKQYKHFLKVIHWLKCDLCICCCCKSVIRSELELEQPQLSELTNLTSVVETEQQHQTDTLLSTMVEETSVNINTFPIHSSKNQGASRGLNQLNCKTKTNDELSSVTLIAVPTLKRDQVSELGIGDSLTNTF